VTHVSVERVLLPAQAWLMASDTPEGVIAAHEAGVADDDQEAARWVRRIMSDQDAAGTWDGELIATAAALMTVFEIRAAAQLREQDPAIGQALDWLRSRRGVPGAWSDGCSRSRHDAGICHHFLGGFFAPVPPEVPLDGVRLRNGVGVEGDPESRFLASVTALRCLLLWESSTPDLTLHLEGLRRIVGMWPDYPPPEISTTSFLAAIHALLLSPVADDVAAAERGLLVLGGRQRGDGSWVDVDPFQALEVFAEAEIAGVAPERSRRALWHGARLLMNTQSANGSWGGDQASRRALIAWRTLCRVGLTRPEE
jgi:hypothetical protein